MPRLVGAALGVHLVQAGIQHLAPEMWDTSASRCWRRRPRTTRRDRGGERRPAGAAWRKEAITTLAFVPTTHSIAQPRQALLDEPVVGPPFQFHDGKKVVGGGDRLENLDGRKPDGIRRWVIPAPRCAERHASDEHDVPVGDDGRRGVEIGAEGRERASAPCVEMAPQQHQVVLAAGCQQIDRTRPPEQDASIGIAEPRAASSCAQDDFEGLLYAENGRDPEEGVEGQREFAARAGLADPRCMWTGGAPRTRSLSCSERPHCSAIRMNVRSPGALSAGGGGIMSSRLTEPGSAIFCEQACVSPCPLMDNIVHIGQFSRIRRCQAISTRAQPALRQTVWRLAGRVRANAGRWIDWDGADSESLLSDAELE